MEADHAGEDFVHFVHILIGQIQDPAAVGAELNASKRTNVGETELTLPPATSNPLTFSGVPCRGGDDVDFQDPKRVLVGLIYNAAAVGVEHHAGWNIVLIDTKGTWHRSVEFYRRAAVAGDAVEFEDIVRVLIGPVDDAAAIGAELLEGASPPVTSVPLSFTACAARAGDAEHRRCSKAIGNEKSRQSGRADTRLPSGL